MAAAVGTRMIAAELIKVVIADARGTERLRWRSELTAATGCAVVAEAVTARQAVAVAGFELPDVVVLGSELPNEDAIDLVAELSARSPRTAVLVNLAGDEGLAGAVLRAAGAVPQGGAARPERWRGPNGA
jgi:DNA-binding NarL/FixJ family response regulator